MCAHNLSTKDLWGSLASTYKVLNKRLCLKREKTKVGMGRCLSS